MMKDFWKELYNNKELVYNILKYAKKEELKNSYLNIFFTQNFYIDLFSNSKEFPNELLYIIQKLLNDIIINIKKISEYTKSFETSNLSYLIDGLILNEKNRAFFNLILFDIIEEYENSEESMQILLFKVNEIKEYFKLQEEKIKHEDLINNKKKSDIIKKRKRENSLLNFIYRMKIPVYSNDSSFSENYADLDYDESINKDLKNHEEFACKYLFELNKNDIIELLNKEKTDIMKSYIRNQLK